MGVVGPDQTTFTVPVPVVVADDLALGIGGGVVADQPAYIDANQVMKRGCRVGVIGNVKLAGITVSPLANGDAPVDRNRFCPVGHGIGGDVLGFDRETMDASTIVESWQRSTGPDVPLGVCDDGTFVFDLVADVPHGLVGGTTGSGKSELLRSLVAGLAARVDPQHLTFILIDFKGGAAFATLDQLPHTIGTLSNLEPSLAFRALQALNAELKRRQQCFADAGEGIDNIDSYLATKPAEPMPRLLLVVDEFAQLAKEYPDVLSGLVSLGAVGRTLGVHMILATQRPDGVVNDDILANTNMRTALRVQSREQSSNVIGVPLAASIGRDQKGRAYIKLGEEDITPIQTALVTGVSGASGSQDLHVDPMVLGDTPEEHAIRSNGGEASDMDVLIRWIGEANDKLGFGSARRVWPEPLSDHVELALEHYRPASHRGQRVVPGPESTVLDVALFDDPEHQRQYISGWRFAGSSGSRV